MSSSSRSPSPVPSLAASSFSRRSGRTAGVGTILSKESLYAPLATYIPRVPTGGGGTNHQDDAASTTSNSSSRNRKSPTSSDSVTKILSIPRELRESTLVDHLATISATYHHPTLSASMMSGGASANRAERTPKSKAKAKARAMGMGRNNGGQALSRRTYEDRLAQRSLILVGGGLLTSTGVGTEGIVAAASSSAASGEAGAGGAGGDQSTSRTVVDVSRAQRRRRKNTRGHRVRGAISNAERKRREISRCGVAKSTTEPAEDGRDVVSKIKRKRATATPCDQDALLRLNDVWNAYMSKLLGLGQDADGATATTTAKTRSIRKRSAAELSTLLSTAELIGAYVAIDRCDASKSYVGKEGIVVDCTANTWRIAIPKPIVGKAKKERKGENDGKGGTGAEKISNKMTNNIKLLGIVWREVVVPKFRSRLSFTVDSDIKTSNERTKIRFVIGESS